MGIRRDTVGVIIGAVVSILLQLIVARVIAVGDAVPNILLAYVIAISLARPTKDSSVLAFVFGVFYDLATFGPLGAMALLSVLAAYILRALARVFGGNNKIAAVVLVIVAAFVIELVYAAMLVAFGLNADLAAALFGHAAPCALYDAIVGIIFYFVAVRLLPDAIDGTNDFSSAMLR